MLSVTHKSFTLNVVMLNVVMLSVVMLSVIMLSVIMLSVVILSVVVPKKYFPHLALDLNFHSLLQFCFNAFPSIHREMKA